jgi:hypothetical protein
MKLVPAEDEKFIFDLGKREKQMLLAVLDRYPVVPPAYQRLSKTVPAGGDETDQHLLDEALAEQRLDNKKLLASFLKDGKRFKETERGCRISLSAPDLEWLLQILNDIRIGSWILLGSPEENWRALELTETTAPHAWAMEMAGYFQMYLLAVLERSET